MFINRLTIFLSVLLVLGACNGDESVKDSFGFEKPAHFPEPTYTLDNNPISRGGFELGKKIFNDPILSRDGTVSCASCHDQTVAFADPQHRLSIGIDGRVGTRNAPPIQNLAFMKNFFWDGGVIHVDFIPPNAITNPLEMDDELANVVQRLNADPEYPGLFRQVFDAETITAPRMLHALSQFMVMMVSADSRYDQYLTSGGAQTDEERSGMVLFESKCSGCHSGVLFTDGSFRNNGLDSEFADPGRARISEKEEDTGKFRVPSLRNVGLTKPYMHDGRFKTLEEVLDHYSENVVLSGTLDPDLNQNGKLGIALTEDEKVKIIVFLNTLTDEGFISNSLFFKR